MSKLSKKERLDAWNNDFDKLLKDPAGLCAFSEFLRKQYSQENINFWVSCENFKLIPDPQRYKFAAEIFDRYFASGCAEPINVDSLVRHNIAEYIKGRSVTPQMYDQAQYQIFHLMKYDCYPRFMKSEDYHKCSDMVAKGAVLPEVREPYTKTHEGVTLSTVLAKASQPHPNEGGVVCPLTRTDVGAAGASSGGSTVSLLGGEKKSTKKTCLPWKAKFSVVVGRNKAAQPSNIPGSMSNRETGADEDDQNAVHSSSEPSRLISHFGSKRKQDWKSNKQFSFPAETIHSVSDVKKHPKQYAVTDSTRGGVNSSITGIYIPEDEGHILAPIGSKNALTAAAPKGILKTSSSSSSARQHHHQHHHHQNQKCENAVPSTSAAAGPSTPKLGGKESTAAAVTTTTTSIICSNSCHIFLPNGQVVNIPLPKGKVNWESWLRSVADQNKFNFSDYMVTDPNNEKIIQLRADVQDPLKNQTVVFRRKVSFILAWKFDCGDNFDNRLRYHAVQVPSNRPIVQTIKQILTLIINETSSGVLRNSLFCICARGHSAGGQSYESTAERLTTEQADNKIIFTLDDRIPVDAKEYDFMVKWGESIRNISEIAGKVIAAAGPKTIYSEYANFVEIFYNEKDYTFYLMPSDKIDRFSSRVTTSAPCLGRPPASYVYVGPEPNSSRSASRTTNENQSSNGINDEKLSKKTRSETTSPVAGDSTSSSATAKATQNKNFVRQRLDDQVQRKNSTSFDVKAPKLRNAHSTGSLFCPACSGGSRRSSNKTPDGDDDDSPRGENATTSSFYYCSFCRRSNDDVSASNSFLRPTFASYGRLGRASVSIPVQLGVFDPGRCDFLTVKRPSDASTTTADADDETLLPPPLPHKTVVDTLKLIVVDPPPPPPIPTNNQPTKINNRNNDQSSIDVTLKSGDLQKFIENRQSLYKCYHPGEVEYV